MKKNIVLGIKRLNGESIFTFNVDESIGKFFEAQAKGEKVRSEKWSGLEFWKLMQEGGEIKNKLMDYGLFNDYGASIMSGNSFNVAWLRTVGGSGEIVLSVDLPFSVLSEKIKSVVIFVKWLLENYYADYTISAKIEVEF